MTRDSKWVRRALGALAAGIVTVVLLRWLGSEPSWMGVLAAVAAAATAMWFTADLAEAVASSSWSIPSTAPAERPSLDGRLAALRRLADTAAEPPPDGSPTRPAAIELQSILRRATEHRIGRAATPEDLPRDLADYLAADPAPLVPTAQLDRLLTRIEEL